MGVCFLREDDIMLLIMYAPVWPFLPPEVKEYLLLVSGVKASDEAFMRMLNHNLEFFSAMLTPRE